MAETKQCEEQGSSRGPLGRWLQKTFLQYTREDGTEVWRDAEDRVYLVKPEDKGD